MKSEPVSYSIDHLKRDVVTPWSGIRNYQSRNFMRDEMQKGDGVLFYHSSCREVGVAGIAEVASAPYPDPTQFDQKSRYYDPQATKGSPRWMLVDIRFVKQFKQVIPLTSLRRENSLRNLMILRPGNRLSITPVTREEFHTILSLAS